MVDEVYELFLDLNATDEQLDFPILYGVAREGKVSRELDDNSENIEPLFETILEHTKTYPNLDEEPVKMQVSALAYDDYIGRLGIGRIYQGVLRQGDSISVSIQMVLNTRKPFQTCLCIRGSQEPQSRKLIPATSL